MDCVHPRSRKTDELLRFSGLRAVAGSPSNKWATRTPATDPNRWVYTGGAASGTFLTTAPDTPGDYEFRYLLNNGYTDAARSRTITVPTPARRFYWHPEDQLGDIQLHGDGRFYNYSRHDGKRHAAEDVEGGHP